MHPNPIYHDAEAVQNLDFARERGFGVLAVNGPDAPWLSHVPFCSARMGRWQSCIWYGPTRLRARCRTR